MGAFHSEAVRRDRGGAGEACGRAIAGFAVLAAPVQKMDPACPERRIHCMWNWGHGGRRHRPNRTGKELSAPLRCAAGDVPPGSPPLSLPEMPKEATRPRLTRWRATK